MMITNGTKLGRYEIRLKIGAGGMGKVYLAQDTKLDRKVGKSGFFGKLRGLAAEAQRRRLFETLRLSNTSRRTGKTGMVF